MYIVKKTNHHLPVSRLPRMLADVMFHGLKAEAFRHKFYVWALSTSLGVGLFMGTMVPVLAGIRGASPTTPVVICSTGSTNCRNSSTDVILPLSTALTQRLVSVLATYGAAHPQEATKIGQFFALWGTTQPASYWSTLAQPSSSTSTLAMPTFTPNSNASAQDVINAAVLTFGTTGSTAVLTDVVQNAFYSSGQPLSSNVTSGLGGGGTGTGGATSGSTTTSGTCTVSIPFMPPPVDEIICVGIGIWTFVTNPDAILGGILTWILDLVQLPTLFSGPLLGAIFTSHGADSIHSLYDMMLPVGYLFAILAAVMRMFSIIGQRNATRANPFAILDVAWRLVFAGAFLYFGWNIIAALASLSETLAITIGHDFAQNAAQISPLGLGNMIANLIIVNVVSEIVTGGAATLFLFLPALILIILMLYVLILVMTATVMILFTSVLAPIFIGLGVYGLNNRFTEWWISMFTGALLAPIIASVGLGITEKAIIVAGTTTITPGWSTVLEIIFACGGIYITGRMINELLKGAFRHGSARQLLMSAGEMAVGASLAGVAMAGAAGAGAGALGRLKAGAQAAGHQYFRTQPGSQGGTLGTGFKHMMGMGGSTATADEPINGVHQYAPPEMQGGLSRFDSAYTVDAMDKDPGAREIIYRATSHMHPSATTAQRVAEMMRRPELTAVLSGMMRSGTYYAQIAGGRPPSQARFHYTSQEMDSLRGTVDHAVANLANGGGSASSGGQ